MPERERHFRIACVFLLRVSILFGFPIHISEGPDRNCIWGMWREGGQAWPGCGLGAQGDAVRCDAELVSGGCRQSLHFVHL